MVIPKNKYGSIIVLLVLIFTMSSCACYHCPRVYKNRVGLPKSIAVPYYKNTKQNKYGPNRPYYGQPKNNKRKKQK